jgi:ubiquinone/menaquinone biosynthesis C-methylase UbiE
MLIFNYSNLVDPLLKNLRAYITNLAVINNGGDVLDACCGTGEQVIDYGRHGINATGIDNDPNMLNIALKNKTKHNVKNISFQLADAIDMPFSTGHFDCASISFALHDKPKNIRDIVISELLRVTKQNGTLILADFKVPLPRTIFGVAARAIEFLVGGQHYQGFKDYLRDGGLDTIFEKYNLNEVHRTQLYSGLIDVIKARMPDLL